MKFRNLVLPSLIYMQYGLSFVEFNFRVIMTVLFTLFVFYLTTLRFHKSNVRKINKDWIEKNVEGGSRGLILVTISEISSIDGGML